MDKILFRVQKVDGEESDRTIVLPVETFSWMSVAAGQLHLISIKNLPGRPIRGGGDIVRYGRLNAEDAEAAEVRREEIKICYSGYDNDR